jgi:NifU-like protein involved in Fe-S cluster formation
LSSRIPLIYSPKVLELFRNPKNLGAIPDAGDTWNCGLAWLVEI